LLVVVVVDGDVIAGHELRGEETLADVRSTEHEHLNQWSISKNQKFWEKVRNSDRG
jgi:hypothetical protein